MKLIRRIHKEKHHKPLKNGAKHRPERGAGGQTPPSHQGWRPLAAIRTQYAGSPLPLVWAPPLGLRYFPIFDVLTLLDGETTSELDETRADIQVIHRDTLCLGDKAKTKLM